MKIIIDRSALVRALGHMQSVVEKKNTIPILSNVLLVAKDQELSLTATDMEIEIRESITVQVLQEGQITLSASKLYEISKKIPEGAQIEVEAESDHGTVHIQSGKSNFKLSSLPVADFPQMPLEGYDKSYEIPATALKTIIDCTKASMSTDETRFYLNGIYIHTMTGPNGENLLRSAATDGHRLARAQAVLENKEINLSGMILPRKTTNELRKILDDAVDMIQVSVSPTKVQFIVDTVTLRSKLIDGTFPDYEKVIPKSNDKVLTVNSALLGNAVGRVAILSNENSRAIKLNIGPGQMTLSAINADSGSAVEELSIDYAGEPTEIGFNAKYVLDILQQIPSDKQIQLNFMNSNAPTVLQESQDDRAVYVLMPMRV